MNFTEWQFLIFFAVFLVTYCFLSTPKQRTVFFLLFSYLFYGIWNWRYIPLLFVASLVDYLCARKISTSTNKKIYLIVSLSFNLFILFVFKYYNFFVSNLSSSFTLINLVLPVGISFYTFQSMAYTIDVYHDRKLVEKSFLNYALFTSFFPQLIAGPIERANRLLPQITNLSPLNYSNMRIGFQLIIFGFFKKYVLADNLGDIVDTYYLDFANFSKLDGIIVLFLYSFQIYFDFSSYTDIARGVAKVFGVNLVENFRLPYLSVSLTEFWKRWHISLTSWFKDYIFYPLCFNDVFRINFSIATIIVFIVSGLWHGASWNFVIWGLINGVVLTIETKLIDKFDLLYSNKITKIFMVAINFTLVTLMWVFFRATNFDVASKILLNLYIKPMGKLTLFTKSEIYLVIFILIAEFITNFFMRDENWLANKNILARWSFYIFSALAIGIWGHLQSKPFIYFQF
jgi:D-alanyl-lipoteichoic acid acyltransferase DltB (MBOAT superfamily)